VTLEVAGLGVRFGATIAVRHCDLEFEPGTVNGLLGPNGAGKTSLLRGIASLIDRDGDVRWCGDDLDGMDRVHRARTLAYLPQGTPLSWPLRVRELVELGRLPHTAFGDRLSERDSAAVQRAMAAANVTRLAERRIDTLSGGELMRAHIARVLAVEAPVLLVDEPIANLDPAHQLLVMELLQTCAANGACILAVMHDVTLAARYCDRVLLLRHGEIVGDGRPGDVLSKRSLGDVYGVAAVIGHHEGDPLVVPWRRIGQ